VLPPVDPVAVVSQANLFRIPHSSPQMIQEYQHPRISEAWPDNIDTLDGGHTGFSSERTADDRRIPNTLPSSNRRNVTNSVHVYVSVRDVERTPQRIDVNDYINCYNTAYYNCRGTLSRPTDCRSDVTDSSYVNYSGSTEDLLSSSNDDVLPVYTDVVTSTLPRLHRI
jgi:hypothetical protein